MKVNFLFIVTFDVDWFCGRSEPEVAEWVQVLKSRYANMKIAVGRDKLDEIQVIRIVLRLSAFVYTKMLI